ASLEATGWVARHENDPGAWVLTDRASRLSGNVLPNIDLRRAVLPIMESLQRTTGETIHLAVPLVPFMILIERLRSSHPVQYVETLGGRASMALTASG